MRVWLWIAALAFVACASSSSSPTAPGAAAGASGEGGASGVAGAAGAAGAREMPLDPTMPGPYTVAEFDDVLKNVDGGDPTVALHCAHPTSGPASGPYPLVLFAHGLAIPPVSYVAYVERLATYGYVAVTVGFSATITDVDNAKAAKDMSATIDWAKSRADLDADTTHVGVSGHSLGGKVALLTALRDARVGASITLDPVDGGGPMGCNEPACVEVASMLGALSIPTAFLGETADATGPMPCAPMAQNYDTFFSKANSPAIEVTVNGADHVSFVPDQDACGIACKLCAPATASGSDVVTLSEAYMVAFYERRLRGVTEYDAWLTGDAAKMRWGGLVAVTSK